MRFQNFIGPVSSCIRDLPAPTAKVARLWVHKRLRLVVLGFAIVLTVSTCAEACPTCKDAVAEGPQHANLIRGYFWSILFMMSMPFVIFSSMAAFFYQQVRKARAAHDASLGLGIHELIESQPETAGVTKTE